MNQVVPVDVMIWLRSFRHRILNYLLGSVLVLGTFGLIHTVNNFIQSGAVGIPLTLGYYVVAYILALVLFFARRVSDRWRAYGFLTLLYIFSVFTLYTGWIAGGGTRFLLSMIVLATLLAGPRAGWIAAVLSLVTYASFGYAHSQGWLIYALAPSLSQTSIVITEGFGFAMAVGLTSIGMWFFRRGLAVASQAVLDAEQAHAELAEQAQELDAANQLLAERTNNLETANQALEFQMWQATGENLIDNALRAVQDVPTLSNNVLQKLCHYLDIPVGALFILEDGLLKLTGKYAYPADPSLPDHFKLGEGLAGQAASEKRTITVTDIPPGSLTVSSGLGESTPDSLLMMPLLYEERTLGVIELGAFGEFTTRQVHFLRSVASNIADAINAAQARARIEDLLEESQRKSEAMRAQEEELRAANEELQAQADALRAGRVEL